MGRYSLQQTGLTAYLAVRLTRSAWKWRILAGIDSWVQSRCERTPKTGARCCQLDVCRNFRLDETSLAGNIYSFGEVTMTRLNRSIARFTGMQWKLGILIFAPILFGVCFTSTESFAQAVPPRVQTLQMIRPPAPPPEPPIQKEIRELKQDVQANTRELERRKQVEMTRESLKVLCPELKRQLEEETQKKNPDVDVIRGLVKKIRNCEQDLQDLQQMRRWR